MAQYNRPPISSKSGSAIWGSFGEYNKVVAVASGGSPYIPSASGAGVAAVLVGATGVGGITGSLGGSILSTDLTKGVVYEIGVRQINVTAGTIYALYKNSQVT